MCLGAVLGVRGWETTKKGGDSGDREVTKGKGKRFWKRKERKGEFFGREGK